MNKLWSFSMQQDLKVTVKTLQPTQALKYIFVTTAFYAAVLVGLAQLFVAAL
ncbi:hypothetical protein AsACE_CH00613 [Acinetobacter schindleri]|nr:hypothetical protein AsACE_CH00613 [Acinetobacter schindleri]